MRSLMTNPCFTVHPILQMEFSMGRYRGRAYRRRKTIHLHLMPRYHQMKSSPLTVYQHGILPLSIMNLLPLLPLCPTTLLKCHLYRQVWKHRRLSVSIQFTMRLFRQRVRTTTIPTHPRRSLRHPTIHLISPLPHTMYSQRRTPKTLGIPRHR